MHRTKWFSTLFLLLLLCILASGCASKSPDVEPAGVYIHNHALSNGTLVEDEHTLFALLTNGASVELHTYDKAAMTERILPIEHIKQEGELLGNHLQTHLLQGDRNALYSMGHGGSGGIYRIDPKESTSKHFDFLPDATIVDWLVLDDKAYFSLRDADGYSLQSREIHDTGFSEESVELLRTEGYGEISSLIHIDDTHLLLHEFTASGQNVCLYDLKTGEKKLIAENVCSDWSACLSGKVMVCQLVEGKSANGGLQSQALIIDPATGDQTIVLELDGLYRPLSAGGKFLLDPLARSAGASDPCEVLVIDPMTHEQTAIALPPGCSNLLGGDSQYAYLWSTAAPAANNSLLALDVEAQSFQPFGITE